MRQIYARSVNFGLLSFDMNASDPTVTMTLHDPALPRKIILSPELAVGEAYVDERLTIAGDDVYGFLTLAIDNIAHHGQPWFRQPLEWGRHLMRSLQQFNPAPRAQANVAHHYDLAGELYDLFLDEDRHGSDDPVTAPRAFKQHVAGHVHDIARCGLRHADLLEPIGKFI